MRTFILFLLIIILIPSCYVGRTIIWNFGDYDDYKKFDQALISKGGNSSKFFDHYTYNTASGEAKKGYILSTGNYYAAGFLGQFIYVYPEKNIIIIRTGKRQGKTDWIKFFRAIAKGN